MQNLELADSARLSHQQAPGNFLSVPLSSGAAKRSELGSLGISTSPTTPYSGPVTIVLPWTLAGVCPFVCLVVGEAGGALPWDQAPGFRACKRRDAVPLVSTRGSHESRVAGSRLSPVYKCA